MSPWGQNTDEKLLASAQKHPFVGASHHAMQKHQAWATLQKI